MTSMPARARRYPGRLALAIVTVCLVTFAAAAVDVPYLTGRVTDNAEILGADARTRLDDLLRAHEQATGNQVAVLTVPTLDGESIEDFSTRVFAAWKLGQKGKDNGALVVVVPRDRRMRIEVGYGLEGLLPDVPASRIVRDVMTPRFKMGDFASGIEDGVKAIIAALTGQAPPPALAGEPARDAAGQSAFHFQGPNLGWPERILIGALIFGIIGLFTMLGIVTPGSGWYLYLFLIPFWAMFPLMIVGVKATLVLFVSYLVAFPILKIVIGRTRWHERVTQELKKKGKTTIGGFAITQGAGGSSWSSGGSSGGGFSGGGGSSGGGGASGSW